MAENKIKKELPPGWNNSAVKAPEWAARRGNNVQETAPFPVSEKEVIAEPAGQPEPSQEAEVAVEQEQQTEAEPEVAAEPKPILKSESAEEPESKQAEKPKADEKKAHSKKGLVIAIVLLLVLAAAGVGAYFLTDGFDKGGHVTQKIMELEAGTIYSADELFAVDEGYSIKETGESFEFYLGEASGSGDITMYSAEELNQTIPVTVVSESGKERPEEFTFTVTDTTAPEITVGDSYALQLGTDFDYDAVLSFSDAGIKGLAAPLTRAEFESALGGNVEIDESALDTGAEGDYTVTIRAEDASGNKTEKSFTVTVSDSGTSLSLDADTQYEANIFLSNFAEQRIVSLDTETCTTSEYVNFIISYMIRNESDQLSVYKVPNETEGYDVPLESLPLDLFESKMTRFFGFEVGRDALNELPPARFNGTDWPTGPFFDGSYLYQYAASGYGIPPVAVVDSVLNFADGHQEMEFTVYDCSWSGSDLYYLTPEQAASDSRLTVWGHGKAIVKPKDWYGRKTYELVSYQCWQ